MNRAGWASGEITPPLGLPMGGRGPRFSYGSEVLSPLMAGVTVLEDGAGRRVALVSVDLISIDFSQGQRLGAAIAAAVGTTTASVIINTSHTHSGPMLSYERYATLETKTPELEAYEKSMEEAVLRLCYQAVSRLQKVKITWREGETNIGINRRLKTSEGVVLGPEPDACYHRQLWSLDIQSESEPGERCILFSHGCHPVIVYGYHWTAISSDWPGRSREMMRGRLGEGTYLQFFQGLAGNIRPRVLADFENRRFRKPVPADLENAAQEFARDLSRSLEQEGKVLSLELAAAQSTFVARRAAPPPREFWEKGADSDDELERQLSRYWLSRYGENAIPPNQSQPWPIGLIRLAPGFVLVHLAGEPLCEWYEVFQEALPDQHILALGYTDSAAGYLPTDALLQEGGYEVERSAAYSKTGPGKLLPGLDFAVKSTLRQLQAFISV